MILTYWVSVRPVASHTGYAEDLCTTDLTRQLMAEQIQEQGRPTFQSQHVMTPQGASIPYMSWSPERDWLGSVFWRWNPDFPFAWAFAGFSWVLSYLIVGFILGRMGKTLRFSQSTAWMLATAVVLFHVPRHFKIWHHWEHLIQHWVFLGLFLDAWLWARFSREKVWDWRIEIWRGFAGIGMAQGVGTFWGPMILEWVIVHGFIFAAGGWGRGRESISVPSWRDRGWISIPIVLSCIFLAMDAPWYLSLAHEAGKFGLVTQSPGWFANFKFFIRPLWLDFFLKLQPIDAPETVVSVGWFYWVPALLGLGLIRKKKSGFGWMAVAPFLTLLILAVIYASLNEETHYFQRAIQAVIPFMSFFRVSSRWGLFLPQILMILTVLCWPELSRWWKAKLASPRKMRWISAAVVFGVLSCLEFSWLAYPVNMMPELPPPMLSMLKEIHDSPGTAVLDLPFCVAGGNGICTKEQCPQYPSSTVSECLRIWHGKSVYGLYQSRMTPAHCAIYAHEPYTDWFSSWQQDRCFTAQEWKGFCSYLDSHPELSAILLYPDFWKGAGTPECLKQFEAHLGRPLSEASLMSAPTRGGAGASPARIFRYSTHCLRQ